MKTKRWSSKSFLTCSAIVNNLKGDFTGVAYGFLRVVASVYFALCAAHFVIGFAPLVVEIAVAICSLYQYMLHYHCLPPSVEYFRRLLAASILM